MPKILINEKDITSPGTPASYANYSVLLAGFKGTKSGSKDPEIVKPDSNEVYEFKSAQAFYDTIGLCSPVVENGDVEEGTDDVLHFGNQMAYELLNMGYSIIYKPISQISDLTDAAFWEVFKDKASYDFRFITHGLLKSAELPSNYANLITRKTEVEEAVATIEKIKTDTASVKDDPATTDTNELSAARKEKYDLVKGNYKGFIPKDSDTAYETFEAAEVGVSAELASLKTEIENMEKTQPIVTENTINTVNTHIAQLAAYNAENPSSGRGDCIALIELDENTYTNSVVSKRPEELIIEGVQAINLPAGAGKYCAMTVPSVVYKMSDHDIFKNKKFPGAFHYLACFINSLKSGFAEWYAAAGYTRGVSTYTIDYTTVKLGEIAINALEPRFIESQATDPTFACNVIANFRGSYYLWGNRTAELLKSKDGGGDLVASHFLNIRQLCTTIKKQLYVACRRFTFDPNSDTLWINFVNAIRPTLDVMKADQGIRDYKILKVSTDKKATLKAKIRIIPIEAVEDFDLEVSLEDSFGETAAVVNE